VAIADLQPDDRLVGYHRPTNAILGMRDHPSSRGYAFERSQRPFDGHLVTIDTAITRTRVTPNHRVLVRFDDDAFCGRWCVYLMRRGDWWRVGTCTTAQRPYRAGGVSGRLSTEQADAGWILGVYGTRREALLGEASIQTKYGIPGLTFQSSTARSLSHEDLARVHTDAATSVAPRVSVLLNELGLDADWPLYRRGDHDGQSKRNLRGNFVTEAANLVALSGRIQMLAATGRRPVPAPATAAWERYRGPVYGLDVPPHHYYVSGGAVVHNSVKGGEADSVYISPELSKQGYWNGWRQNGPARDQIVRLFYVMMTRARERVTILAADTPENVRDELCAVLPAQELAAAA